MAVDVFTKHRYFLRFLGIVLPGEVPNKYHRLILEIWRRYLALCLPALTLCFLLGVVRMHREYSVTATMYSVSGVISTLSATIKLYLLHHHRKDIKELVDVLCHFKADTPIGRYTTILTYAFETLTLGFRAISLTEVLIKGRKIILMPFWTPYSRENVSIAIATYFFYQGSAIIKSVCNFFTDAVFLNLSNQICHRMYILKNTFELIGLPEDEKVERMKGKYVMQISEDVVQDDEKLLRACIAEHILILKMLKRFSLILNRLFLPQCFNAFFSICVVLFLVSQADNMVGEAFKVTPWTTLIFLQLFVSCFAGELIKQKFHDFYLASYNNNWYNCSQEIKSSVLIIQTYTSHQKFLKGAFVFDLSLHTYETAVREVFSTFTVLYHLFNTK